MAEKISWTELRHIVAVRAGVSEKEAGLFLNALNSQVFEALKQDKQVKINGLGTFRLQAVAARRSVSVNTGEETIVPGYNKLVFIPEAGLKELIEKTSADEPSVAGAMERREINPLQKLGEQAEEIVGLLGELNDVKPEEPEAAEEPETVEDPQPAAEEPEPEPVFVQEPVAPQPEPQPEEKPKKKYHFLRDTLICVIILLLLLLVGYFFLRHQLTNWIEGLGKEKPVVTEQTERVPSTIILDDEDEDALKPQPQTYGKNITTEPIHYGSRLAWISMKYYGAKIYWPYLYDANKDKLDDPNKIITGTPIRVPRLTSEQMDTTNEQTLVNIEYLRQEAIKRME